MLEIKNLHVRVEGNQILHGLDLSVKAGEVHAVMGPNGSGKSTLAQVIAGRENYEVTAGEILYEGKNLLEMSPEVRAGEGIFLGFQYPVEIPGIANMFFMRAALNAVRSYRGEEEIVEPRLGQQLRMGPVAGRCPPSCSTEVADRSPERGSRPSDSNRSNNALGRADQLGEQDR